MLRRETSVSPRAPGLADRIRAYTLLDADVGEATLERATPVRPQQFLQLVLDGEPVLRNVATGRLVRPAKATLIGLCTYRKYNLEVGHRLRMFCVQFQPGALHAWSGLDARRLTDECHDARAVFGDAVDALARDLATARGDAARVAIADAWFAALPAAPLDDIAAAGRRIRDAAGAPPIALSARQFQRRFARQVGLTPKHYARLCRLAGVIDMHEAEPTRAWTNLAHAAGYADQAHLSREFREIVGDAPSRFRRWRRAERVAA